MIMYRKQVGALEKYKNPYLLLTLVAICWGAQPVLIKYVIREITPITLTSVRWLILSSTLFLIIYLTHDKAWRPTKKTLPPLLVMGLLGVALNNVAQFSGLNYSTVINCTLISATTPVMTAFLAAIFIHERLNTIQWFGILISIGGALFLISNGNLMLLFHISLNYGDTLFLISQLGWAGYSLISIKVMKNLSVLATTAWAGIFGSIMTAFYGLYHSQLYWAPVSMFGAFSLIYVIWGGGVCAMLFYNMSVKAVGPSRSAIFLNIMPIVGIICGILFLHESFHLQQLLGAAAILSGVYITTHNEQITALLNK